MFVVKILSKYDGDSLHNAIHYRTIVEALQYCTLIILDICCLVNKLHSFLHSPTITHWNSMKRLLRYLKGTYKFGLILSKSDHLSLSAYTDSN